MKWHEMSLFDKVFLVIGCLCAVAFIILAVCAIAGLVPNTDAHLLGLALLGGSFLSRYVLNRKTQRGMAIGYLVFTIVLFALAIAVFVKR